MLFDIFQYFGYADVAREDGFSSYHFHVAGFVMWQGHAIYDVPYRGTTAYASTKHL